MIERSTLEIARWEWRRFFKWKQQLMGAVVLLVFMGIGGLGGRAAARVGQSPVDLAVLGADELATHEAMQGPGRRFDITPVPPGGEAEARAAVEAGNRDGLLIAEGPGAWRLVARRAPGWRDNLEQRLRRVAAEERIAAANFTAEQLAALDPVIALEVEVSAPREVRGAGALGTILVLFIALGTFTAMGYNFQSITAEKQNRVTEQLISAITPQSWMDGKILGLAAVSIASMLSTTVLLAATYWAVVVRWRGGTMPSLAMEPMLLVFFLLFMLLGFLFWLTALAVVAATIDDPHNSTRTQLLMLPILCASAAFLVQFNADALLVRMLGQLPLTSPFVMTARIVATDVPVWEPILAIALLAGAILLLRRAAARIFHASMLMYGKEPSWSEIVRLARTPG